MPRSARRHGVLLALLTMLAVAVPSLTQGQTLNLPGIAAAAPTPPQGSVADLIRRIENPEERAALLTALRALETTPTPATPASADDASAGLLDAVANEANLRVSGLIDSLGKIAAQLALLPTVGEWFVDQARLDYRRDFWLSILLGLAMSLGCGSIAWWLTRSWMRRTRSGDPDVKDDLTFRRRATAFGRRMAPAAAFVVVSGLAMDVNDVLPATKRVGWLIILAVLAGRGVRAAVRYLYPAVAEWPATPKLLRAGGILVYGGTTLLVAGRLGLPQHLYDLFEHLLFFALTVQLSLTLHAARGAIAEGFRILSTWSESKLIARVLPLDAITRYGHVSMIVLVWMHFIVWAIDVPSGFVFLFRATAATLLLLLLGQVVLAWLDRSRAEESQAAMEADPGLDRPVTPPRSLGRRLLRIALKLLVLLAILEAWGLGIIAWLQSPSGAQFVDKMARLAVIVALSWLLARIVNHLATSHLAAKDAEGNTLYSNRLRTLVTIARSVTLLVIAIIAGATMLDELGIQTAPLLAGAGVVGLAVGFGSQKLVQDIITGMFILLGDTIRVGDVVNLGARSGVVEAMTMRTVTLRSYNGDVHTIPYGAIDVVTNQTRDFSFWVLDVSIDYRESADRVIDLLREIDAQIRREWPWRRLILEPVEIAGVDRFADSAVVIRARVRTRPGEQWRVGRELNRRIKLRFDELGIEIPFPQRTVHFVTASKGHDIPAPPVTSTEAALALPGGRNG